MVVRYQSDKHSSSAGSGISFWSKLYTPPVPATVKKSALPNAPYFKLKKGFDVKIEGKPVLEVREYKPSSYAVDPRDINGISPIPKVEVEAGAEVKAGDVLFFDKKNPKIKYTAPVSGEIAAINRAEKRAIAEIVILADTETKFRAFDVPDLGSLSREAVVEHMLEAGLWPLLKQRPFNELAEFNEVPKGIFISSFDSSPMAPDYNFTLSGEGENFQAGIDALTKLTDGDVHLGLDARNTPSDVFTKAKNVKHYWFDGKHPSGMVGIQIHHIDPIRKGEIVWTLSPEDVVIIGRYFREKKYDPVRTVALGGPELKSSLYFRTRLGANISGMLENNLENDHVRVISGNVLTGKQINSRGYLGYYSNQISVIEEGDKYEMFGWLIPSYMRPSLSPTFPAVLFPNYRFRVNTNTHGEHRAFVVTGQYEQVLPMDLYPQHLLKSIIANDIDKMEGLGIYEVVEEDLAICEFVCTSKQEVQQILREGLEYIKEQG